MGYHKSPTRKIILGIFSIVILASPGLAAEITRNTMDALNSPSGWGFIQFESAGGAIVSADSPQGGTALRYTFPIGMGDGREPARVWYNASKSLTDVYIQFYHKYSSNYVFHEIGNKILYMYSGGSRQSCVVLTENYGDLKMEVLWPTVSDLVQYSSGLGRPTRGVWYKYAIHMKTNSSPGSSDGILELWVNDKLVINKNNVMYFPSGTSVTGWVDFDLAAAYGGGGGSNPVVSYAYYDDVIISSNAIFENTTEIPIAPSNLKISR